MMHNITTKNIIFLIIFLTVVSCKNDYSNYYNAENEQYIDELESEINYLENEKEDLELNIEELEDKLLDYE